ncbi:MAG: c-type cytochrome [Acidobacteriota bacterium]
MYKLGLFLAGALSAVATLLGVLLMSAHGFSAREQPGTLERWVARQARALALPKDARQRSNPVPDSPQTLADARAHWADHCAVCHANNGSGDVEMGKHMYPQAPDMRQPETQHMTDGELFFIIQNGIRMTGMPAWGSCSQHDEQDSWKLVRFIRHLPQLSAEEEREMQTLNPKSPDELKEEREERDFLNGESSHEPTEHHHH